MNNFDIKKLASESGFKAAYFLPPPDYASHDDEPHIIWNAAEYPWADVTLLLIWAYSPYPPDVRIPSYYINSNASYHASVALARRLEAEGVKLLRCEVPIKQMALRYGIASPCRNSLVAVPGFGTRVVFQSMLLGSSENHSFAAESYNIEDRSENLRLSCNSCRACINACPAHAISENGLDVKKCMRFYMDGADYPDWVYDIQRTHMGCEVCQQVCPRNAGVKAVMPPEDVVKAFDLETLSKGITKPARLLVGKNFTGNGKLAKEAEHFLKRDG